MKLVHLFCLAVGLTLSACGIADDGGMRSPVPVPAGGSGSGVSRPMAPPPIAPESGDLPAQPQAQPMLEDPEAQTESWSEEIYAASQADADRICGEMAQNYANQGSGVVSVEPAQQLTKTPTQYGDYRFVCRFKAEV